MSGDIGQIQVGRPPASLRPAAPVAAPSPVVQNAPSRPAAPPIAPPAPSARKGRKWLLIGLGVVILVVLAAIVSAMLGGSGEPTPTLTPTPTAAATLAPQTRNLASYFGNPSTTVTLQQTSAPADFRNSLVTAQPPAGQAIGMSVQMGGSTLSPKALLEALLGIIPADVTGALGSDIAVLAYGQTEAFDTNGAKTTTAVSPRLALVMEVTDATAANQAMLAWEGTGLASVSETHFDYRLANRIVEGFSTGTYRQMSVRYWNFPYADHSLDWAIVPANGKNYLVLTGSRESAFFAIDQLMQ